MAVSEVHLRYINVSVRNSVNFASCVWACVCATVRVTLRQEYRLTVFGDRLLRKIFGLKMDEVTAE